ncbi:MAG TPA: phage portal protein [Solirubrobacterales bacterium]|nr:phage portal protein [Solirubrobacterales bacterium]
MEEELASIPLVVRKQLSKLLEELDQRARLHRTLDSYYVGDTPIPDAIVQAKVTRAYRNLMPVSTAPWGSLVVDSTQDRLEPSGISSEERSTDKLVWGLWQDNQMDAEWQIAQNATLVDGRSFAIVWRPPGSSVPEVSLDNSATVAVLYREGSRRHRVAAVRRWVDEDGRTAVNLYTPDFVWKFIKPMNGNEGQSSGRVHAAGVWWERREDDPEWPLQNPWGVVPVVEIPINRRLKQGVFPPVRGDFAHCLGLIDRIHLLTFLGLVVAFWMGFPLRGIIGEKILRDDDNNVIPPFDANAAGLAQLEDPAAKIFEYKAADRKNLSVMEELDQFSSITKTPRHYFPLEKGMSNLSAEAIMATEGALHAKVSSYKKSVGEGGEEVLRLLGLMSDEEVVLSPRAELHWMNHESRSLAEAADAATKWASIGIPIPVIADKCLNFSAEEISKLEAQMLNDPLSKLVVDAAKKRPAAEEEPEPVAA